MVECPGHNYNDRHGRYCMALTSDCLYRCVIDVATKNTRLLCEPRYEKTGFLHMQKRRHRSAAQLISPFVFAIRIVQSLFYLNPKIQASSHLLWLYSPVG